MYAYMWKPEDIGHPALSLYIYPRQNLSLSLELNWQPGSPSGPPFSAFPNLRGYRCVWDHVEPFLWVLRILHAYAASSLSHEVMFPAPPPALLLLLKYRSHFKSLASLEHQKLGNIWPVFAHDKSWLSDPQLLPLEGTLAVTPSTVLRVPSHLPAAQAKWLMPFAMGSF